MEMFVVQGGSPLAGTVQVSGAKNAALPIMAAALMVPGRTVLNNVPDLVDVRTLSQLLDALGVSVCRSHPGALELDVFDERPCVAEYDLVRRMRASVCVLGPLLARRRRACVSLPGGCNIGHRPIDLHLKGLAALGADLDVRSGYVQATARQLYGTRIDLAGPHGSTVTGTCNVLTAACLARGTTVIDHAACEPEVAALADFLNARGARITGQGTRQIVIDGVEELAAEPDPFRIIPDRVEAATLLIAAAITRGRVMLEGACSEHLTTVLGTLAEIGATISEGPADHSPPDRSSPQTRSLLVEVPSALRPVHVTSLPYPGFPTDVQAQLIALLCTVPGQSLVRDLVFPDRFMHVAELCRMGAQIRQQQSAAFITGVSRLTGAQVMASDLRASAALVLAALAAEGETVVRRIYHLDRGYELLERKLRQLGGRVQRLQDDQRPLKVPLPTGLPADADWQRKSA